MIQVRPRPEPVTDAKRRASALVLALCVVVTLSSAVPAPVLSASLAPRVYDVAPQEETPLSSDRFFAVSVAGRSQLCLFKPIKLQGGAPDGPSSMTIYAIGHDKSTDRIALPQAILMHGRQVWLVLAVVALLAGFFHRRLLTRLQVDLRSRVARFAVTALGAFVLLAVLRACLGVPGSILWSFAPGEMLDGGGLCIDNASGSSARVYANGRLHAVVPGGDYLIIEPAALESWQDARIQYDATAGDWLQLPLSEKHVHIYNVRDANRYFVKAIEYQRR